MKRLFLVLLVATMCGCASHPVTHANVVQLLPTESAQAILRNKLGAQWVNAPYIIKDGGCVAQATQVPIAYRDIITITYNASLGRLYIFKEQPQVKTLFVAGTSCTEQIAFTLDAQSANEVATALKSLGACTSARASAAC